MVGDARGHQPADQVARDIAGDVGGERAARVHRAAFLAEIGKRERECGGHAEPLCDPQDRECREVRRGRQQSGRNGEHAKAHQNPEAPVDPPAEQRHREPRDRHAHRAGIDGEAHRGGRYSIGLCEGGQDRLCGEQIDHGEKCRQADDDGPAQHVQGVIVPVHILRIPRHRAHRLRHLRHRLTSTPDYSAACIRPAAGSCRITPSRGSASSSQGASSSARMVLA